MDIQMFTFKRGEAYTCTVAINRDGAITFHNIMYPPTTTDEVMNAFMEDAERAAVAYMARKESVGND